ncbi:FAD-binding protein [Pseudonocardia alaniniphila]|uniref:FAD-binding protein n=1 Tax=Pseudonocardia alaniniphila TaxID=75291 RepID=UPI00363DC839
MLANRRGCCRPVRDGQVVLHLGRRMNRILEVDERLGYALIEPGVTFWELRAELARRGDTRPPGGSSPSTGSTTRRSSSAVHALPVPCMS